MPDLLDRIRDELTARLTELRPLVDEHRRLQAAMHALGDIEPGPADDAATRAPAKTATSRARRAPAAKRRARAPRGANREAVLRAAAERPGATSSELAAVSGVEPKTLSGLLTRLVKSGELQKRALPTGRTGYALADTPRTQAGGARSGDAEGGADAINDASPPDRT